MWGRRTRLAMVCGLFVASMLSTFTLVHADDPLTAQTAITRTEARVGRTSAQQALTLSVPLKVRDQTALDTFLHDLYDPASPSFHHYLTPAEYTNRFVDASARKQAVAFLQGKHLSVDDSGLGTVIKATGNVADIERAFNLTISDYKDSAGRVFFANDATPAIPASVAASVQGIIGLDNAVQDRPHIMPRPLDLPPGTQADQPQLATGCTEAVNIANTYRSYTPNQLSTAYNFDFFATDLDRGEGQVVALFEEDNYLDSNATAYQNCFGTAVPLTRVPVDGGAAVGDGEDEVELDIDVIAGMAPHLGQILVYNTPNSTANANDTYQRIANDDAASVVSTSWGNCEQNRSTATLNARNAIFQQMAAQGQSMFAAAGDNGSEDCQSGTFLNSLAVDDPASQPYVTAVGGTTLTVNSANAYSGESVWNEYYRSGGAGGGGVSAVWPKPAYQHGPGIDFNTFRRVPDISADADPYAGYTVYVADATDCPQLNGTPNCFAPFGGTSASAPFWAAMTALTNQALARKGLPHVGFLNPLLYPFLPNVSAYSTLSPFPFHDVTGGDNCYKPASGCGTPASGRGLYPALVGYDHATGIGSMNAGALVTALSPPVVSSLSVRSGSAAGNTPVVITGENFQAGATVAFGGVPGINVNILSPTTITATTPAHAAGVVDITVTNVSGHVGTLAHGFTFVTPTIAGISPDIGPVEGGVAITITGANFALGATVTIGGVPASAVSVASTTQITCTTPPTAGGFTTVVVTNPDGATGSLPGGFDAQLRYGGGIPGSVAQPAPVPRASDSSGGPAPAAAPSSRP
jgi:subtilase family serine protease